MRTSRRSPSLAHRYSDPPAEPENEPVEIPPHARGAATAGVLTNVPAPSSASVVSAEMAERRLWGSLLMMGSHVMKLASQSLRVVSALLTTHLRAVATPGLHR